MGTFHDQWMDGWREVAEVADELRGRLRVARDLIDEDNTPADRRRGGQIIREVRQATRRACAGLPVPEEYAEA